MPAKTPARRGRSAKPALSSDAVLAAAVEIVRTEGIDALTMRRLAGALDTGAASLYVYFANRDELLRATFNRIVGDIELPEPEPERWREQVIDQLVRSRKVMEAHPGIARIAVAEIPSGTNALRGADSLMGLLRAGGVPDTSVAWVSDMLFLLTTAAALETGVRAEGEGEMLETVQARFESLPAEEFPNIAAIGPALFTGDSDERFRYGIELMLNGLAHTPAPDVGGD